MKIAQEPVFNIDHCAAGNFNPKRELAFLPENSYIEPMISVIQPPPRSVFRLVLFLLTVFSSPASALCADPTDSAAVIIQPMQDPAALPPAQPDTLSLPKAAEHAGSALDTTIRYSARSIEFLVDDKRTILRGDAQVQYKNMKLVAERIIVDWQNNLVIAEGIADTLWVDSAKTVVDTILVRGSPVFTEDNEEIHGARMTYNLKSRRGRITEGKTAQQEGYYWGGALKKDTSNVLYAGPASYTTCNLEEPHYTFRSKEMKLVVGDKVIAKPVVLYFSNVPVAAIPFGIFPSRKGRQSGLIVPTYGESGTQGRYIRHLGYYWAPNDYSDFTSSLDYYERSGFLFHGTSRYNWRYHLSGNVEASITRQHFAAQKTRRWEVKALHDQQIDPNTRLNLNANFTSDKSYYQDYSFNLNEQLSQVLRSDATLTHSFPDGKNSLSANVHHEQNLRNDEITQDIPRIAFRRGQSAIIPLPRREQGDTTDVVPAWYNGIYYSYSGEFLHRRVLDQVISYPDTSLIQDKRAAARHSLSFNSPQKVSYFSITPSLNYSEQWFGEYKDYSAEHPLGRNVNGFKARRTFNAALGLTTKLYGYWLAPLPGVEAIRHTATPTISFNYSPDFSDPQWGYYQTFVDSTGASLSRDRFTGSLFGGTPSGKTRSLNFQLANLFQMKYRSGDDTKKVDLFNLNFSTNYNFAADSLKFSPLTSSFRAAPISSNQRVGVLKSLSFDLSTNHSFYKFRDNHEINEYYFDPAQGKILRLRSFDISANSGFSIGSLVRSPETTRGEERDRLTVSGGSVEVPRDTTYESHPPVRRDQEWYLGKIPWDLQLALHYTANRYNPNNPSETFWLNATVDASLTQNWQISYNTRIDLVENKVVSAGLTIYRDLHCWEARFVWNPLGIGEGYYLKINIKSPQLQDVKVERRRGQGTFMGF